MCLLPTIIIIIWHVLAPEYTGVGSSDELIESNKTILIKLTIPFLQYIINFIAFFIAEFMVSSGTHGSEFLCICSLTG